MPRDYLLVYRFGGGDHPRMFGVKTVPNSDIAYQEKSSIEGVVDFIDTITDPKVLRRTPKYEHLSPKEQKTLEDARLARISKLEE